MKKVVAGNWKMHTTPKEGISLLEGIFSGLQGGVNSDVIIIPPFTHLYPMRDCLVGKGISLGAQNLSISDRGAHTGEISAGMLASLGCEYVLIGHSERREVYGEGAEFLEKKLNQAYLSGLVPIYCVGESYKSRDLGEQAMVVSNQLEVLKNIKIPNGIIPIVAYEPVWAIGTGLTASVNQISEMHSFIASQLSLMGLSVPFRAIRILYGGSVKPDNADEILSIPFVDGVLVGGASLKAEDFLSIVLSAEKYA
jgi:triosephosphate isomerase